KTFSANLNGGIFDRYDENRDKGKAVYQALATMPDGSRTIVRVGADGALISTGPKPYDGQNLASNASVSIEQARLIALKARPGSIADEELEKEKGGSGLRYSFDI